MTSPISTPAGPSKRIASPGLQLLSGMHQRGYSAGARGVRVPECQGCREARSARSAGVGLGFRCGGRCRLRFASAGQQEAFDRAAARDAVPEQAGGDDARVVDDQEIAGAKK